MIRALQEARDDGRQLQIEPNIGLNVRRALNLVNLDRHLVGEERFPLPERKEEPNLGDATA